MLSSGLSQPSNMEYVLDPLKCKKLSEEEKIGLIYEISKWPHDAPQLLKSWSRQELLQILSAETGKERKCTSWPKLRIIEFLLKSVAEKSKDTNHRGDHEPQPEKSNSNKRQRKTDDPLRIPISTCDLSPSNSKEDTDNTLCCQNISCRAVLSEEEEFCKSCSCIICHQHDENKDPSVWLVCSSTSTFEGDSCGMKCHIQCALKHKRVGISKYALHETGDGSFYCIYCGKVNDLLRCYQKLLMRVKQTTCVETLCARLSLAQKLLQGTPKYCQLLEAVDAAAEKLEAEVGPLAGPTIQMGSTVVNKLSAGAEVQKLCASALESLDSLLSSNAPPKSKCNTPDSSLTSLVPIKIENVSPTSLIVVLDSENVLNREVRYKLWCRRADVMDYPAEPICTMCTCNTRPSCFNLTPATEYMMKVTSCSSVKELGTWEVGFKTSAAGNDEAESMVLERGQSPATDSGGPSNPSEESNNLSGYQDQLSTRQENHIEKSGKLPVNKDLNECWNRSIDAKHRETPENSVSAMNGDCLVGGDNQLCNVPQGQTVKDVGTDNRANNFDVKGRDIVPFEHESDCQQPSTRRKLEFGENEPGLSTCIVNVVFGKTGKDARDGSFTKKRRLSSNEECPLGESLEEEYEHCVKKIRCLEIEGFIEKNFRLKFLTWYSLRATPEDSRIVKVYVDTMIDDPISLSGQLVHSFGEKIFSKRPLAGCSRFCPTLWH